MNKEFIERFLLYFVNKTLKNELDLNFTDLIEQTKHITKFVFQFIIIIIYLHFFNGYYTQE